MGPGSFPKFLVRTDSPRTYWIGVRLPNLERGGPAPLPLVLLLASPSISAGGLWIDPTPWVVVAAAIILGSALFWFPLVHGITRSIKRMTLATEMIAAGRLETRLQETRSDELGRLGQAINGMTERLSEFVSGQKRFLGDTAHELCSPLARIQMALGILEQRADPPAQAYVNDVREEVEHMSGLVNELLSFSKASLRPADVKLQAVDLSKLVQQTLRREGKEGVDIQVAVPEHLQVLAEPDLLARSLSNLLRNAVRYAGSAGPIVLTAEALRDQVRLTVADQGPGIPEHSLSRIFDPFYRPQEARERETGGVGLGLAIVKTCLEACRGEVSARNRTPSGLEVIVLLRRV